MIGGTISAYYTFIQMPGDRGGRRVLQEHHFYPLTECAYEKQDILVTIMAGRERSKNVRVPT